MIPSKNLILGLALSFSCLMEIYGQSVQDLKSITKDFDFFFQQLQDIHPDPYSAFGGPIEFNREKQILKSRLTSVQTTEDFSILLSSFVSKLKDGHTFIQNSSEVKEPVYLPFKVKVACDQIFITQINKDYLKYKGYFITSINHIPIDSLLQRLHLARPSENRYGDYLHLTKIVNSGEGFQSLFISTDSISLALSNSKEVVILKFPINARGSNRGVDSSTQFLSSSKELIVSEMIGPAKDVGYFKWNSIVSREYVEYVYKNSPQNVDNALSWAYSYLPFRRTRDLENDVARIPALYSTFFSLLNDMRTHKSHTLIIDLRDNSGGMTPLVEPLLYMLYGDTYLNFRFKAQYITRLSSQYLHKVGIPTIDGYNNTYSTNYCLGDYNFNAFGDFAQGATLEQKRGLIENAYYSFGSQHLQGLKGKPIYSPNIIVLTSPTTFSAAFHFAYFLKKLGNAKILGVPSSQSGNGFMETTSFKLPNTKLSGSISNSVQVLFPNDPETGNTLQPDIPMYWIDYEKYNFNENAEVFRAIDYIKNGH